MQAIFLLNGCSDGNGAWSSTDTLTLHQAVAHLAVHIFAAVGGDINVSWFELAQALYGVEEVLGSRSLQRRKHLKRESRSLFAVYDVYYVHVMITGITVEQ
jgi:hypothetical protein